MPRTPTVPKGAALPTPPEHHWSVREIAAAHGMSDDAVLAAVNRGELKARKPGKDYQIPDSWYREWLNGCTIKPSKQEARA